MMAMVRLTEIYAIGQMGATDPDFEYLEFSSLALRQSLRIDGNSLDRVPTRQTTCTVVSASSGT